MRLRTRLAVQQFTKLTIAPADNGAMVTAARHPTACSSDWHNKIRSLSRTTAFDGGFNRRPVTGPARETAEKARRI